ncbi:hypothetical protein UFOVP1367_5 [uncultured Caudovirales phage]|uniref:Uncharacterized protein n=1 Tax=uncultured Caudovirales phage TaxID=2100421 RepID=A0A6J5S336_9CAUD|nr:hypothetical protein KNT69_gp05 [uncultured Caudovirales phage]CAB4202281.1 hypothetical protein UFOVP1367_5 [uncultured Caudovirales phage]
MKNATDRVVDKSVPEALTLLAALKTNTYDRLSAQFTVATHDLDQFVIKGQVHPSAPLETLYSSSGSFTTPTGLLMTASGDLTTQAAGATGSFVMDVGGYYQVNIYAASVHAGGSLVNFYSSLR